MKIVSWNCCKGFHQKSKLLLEKLPADIYVIQECADPSYVDNAEYKSLLRNGFWVGGTTDKSREKGMAIFSLNENIKFEKLDWEDNHGLLKYFLPVRVNNKFTLIGVWTHKNYCVQCFDYITANESKINEDCIFIGDFNSNITQDYNKPKKKTWAKCVEFFEKHGLCDAYHYVTGEEQGKEKMPTHYLYRHLDRPYHFNHCLVNKKRIVDFAVGEHNDWLKNVEGKSTSDHMPIIIDIGTF